jgi:hypothetical protein
MACNVCQKSIGIAQSIGTWVRAGAPLTRIKDFQTRLDICKDCQHFDGGFCGKCGCVILLKARLATSQCPEDKW